MLPYWISLLAYTSIALTALANLSATQETPSVSANQIKTNYPNASDGMISISPMPTPFETVAVSMQLNSDRKLETNSETYTLNYQPGKQSLGLFNSENFLRESFTASLGISAMHTEMFTTSDAWNLQATQQASSGMLNSDLSIEQSSSVWTFGFQDLQASSESKIESRGSISDHIPSTQQIMIESSLSSRVDNSYLQVERTSLTWNISSNINSSRLLNSILDSKGERSQSRIKTTEATTNGNRFISSTINDESHSTVTHSVKANGEESKSISAKKMLSLVVLSTYALLASLTSTELNALVQDTSALASTVSRSPEFVSNMTSTKIESTDRYGYQSGLSTGPLQLSTVSLASSPTTVYQSQASVATTVSTLYATSSAQESKRTQTATIEAQASTPLQISKTSVILSPVTTLPPSLSDQYLMFGVSGLLRNESFHQDLVNHTSAKFVFLASRVASEVRHELEIKFSLWGRVLICIFYCGSLEETAIIFAIRYSDKMLPNAGISINNFLMSFSS